MKSIKSSLVLASAALVAGVAIAQTTTTTEIVPAVNGVCSVSSSSSSSGNGSTSVSVSVVNNGNGTCTVTTTRSTDPNGGVKPPVLGAGSPICTAFPFFSFCK
jgi:hypothetical protein